MRPTTCPWQAMRDPFVDAVLRERRWWDRGEPSDRRGALPRALVDGIEEYEVALTAVLVHDARIEREQAEKNRERERRPAGVPRSFRRPSTRGGRRR